MHASGDEFPLQQVECEATRTALLVIDLQWQFTDPESALYVPGAEAIVAASSQFAARIRAAGGLVVWPQQSLREQIGGGVTSKRYGLQSIHRGAATELDAALELDPSDVVLPKWRQSSFFATDLDVMLRMRGIETVLIAGVTTNVCVLAAAKDASERDYRSHVVADLTGSLAIKLDGRELMSAAEVQRSALAFCQYAYGDVTSTGLISLDGVPAA
jgi:nicotinamidase-related amidase